MKSAVPTICVIVLMLIVCDCSADAFEGTPDGNTPVTLRDYLRHAAFRAGQAAQTLKNGPAYTHPWWQCTRFVL